MAFFDQANITRAGTTSTTIANAYTNAVRSGACLVALASWNLGTGSATFSDTVNGSWASAVLTVNSAGKVQSISVGVFPNSAAGTPTVTATFGSSGRRVLVLASYYGIVPSGAVDTFSSTDQGGSVNPTAGNTGNVTNPNEMVVCFSGAPNTTDTYGVVDLVMRNAVLGDGNAGAWAIADKVGPATGTAASGTFTLSAADATLNATIVLAIDPGIRSTGPGANARKYVRWPKACPSGDE